MSGSLRVLPADTPRLDARSFRPRARLRQTRCASTIRAASAACTTPTGDPNEHPLLAKLAPEPLDDGVQRGLSVARHPPPARGDQTAADEQPAGRRRRQHLRERSAVPGESAAEARRRAVSTRAEVTRLVRAVRSVLAMAIRVGGTTLRDYVGADGAPGIFPAEAVRVRARRQAVPKLRHAGPPAHAGAALHVLLPDLPEVSAGHGQGFMSEHIHRPPVDGRPGPGRRDPRRGPVCTWSPRRLRTRSRRWRRPSRTSSSMAPRPARSSDASSRPAATGRFPTPQCVLDASHRERCAPPASPSRRSPRSRISPTKTLAGVVPDHAGARGAGGRRDHRAPHAGPRHRPLDGRDAAHVPARAPGRAAGRRLRRARGIPRRLRPARDAAARRRSPPAASAGARTAAAAAWYLWRAVELKRAGTLPRARRAHPPATGARRRRRARRAVSPSESRTKAQSGARGPARTPQRASLGKASQARACR